MKVKICNVCLKELPLGDFVVINKYSNTPSYTAKCRKCYNESYRMRYRLNQTRNYDICSACHCVKPLNTASKCNECIKIAKEKRKEGTRKFKGERPKNYKQIIKEFVDRIIQDKMMVTLSDINDIVIYYSYVTYRITEYDAYSVSTQINLMFKRLVEEVRKK